jgi:glycosyltransferase involved in cell wall biosynthesis
MRPLTPTQVKKFEGLARGMDVLVIAFSADALPRRFVHRARFYLLPALPVRQLRYALLFALGPVLGLWCVVRHRADVLVGQSPYEGCIGAWVKRSARLLLRRRVALIVESHGDFEQALFLQRRIRRTQVYARLMRAAARVALRHADALRAISTATRDQLRRLGATQPLVQFSTWTDVDVFLEAGRHRSAAGRDVLYAGVLTPLKGVHHLVAAFATISQRFPGVRLVMIGKVSDTAYRLELDNQIGALGIGEAVTFMPELPQTDLAGFMATARVLVLPSYSEGLGRVVFEAMAVGTPVIGSAVGGIPDLIQDGVTGFLVAPGDERQLAERLATVLGDSQLSSQLGAAARKVAVESLSTDRYFAEYERLVSLAAASAASDGRAD